MPLDFDYEAAKQAGYSDDDILNGLQSYGKLDFDLSAARKAGYSPSEIMGTLTAPTPQKEDKGDFGRGAKEAFQQLPQLGYGLMAGAGAALESAVGEGGIATGIKKAGVQGYQDWGNKIAADSKESDSFSYSYDKAKEGDFGAMVDWIQHGLGYAGGQGIQMLATAGIGSLVGKATLKTAAEKIASGMVEKEVARIAAGGGAAMGAEQVTKLATANVAAKLGQTAAIGAQAFGQEGGEIFGDLSAKSVQENRALSGDELAKAFGATLAAGGLEFIGDKVGLDVMLGKSALLKPAADMTGIGGRAARGAIAAAGAAPIEGATEYAQTLLEEGGKGNDPLSDASLRQAKDAAALGAIGGVAMGGAGGVVHGAQQAEQAQAAPEQAPLQIANNPDPLLSFPDGTVGRRADVENFISSLPEERRIDARARLFGLGAQQAERATVDDITQANTVNDAISAASDMVNAPSNIELQAKNEQIDAAWRAYSDNLTKQRDADFSAMQQQRADQQVEQAQAITQAQGFDTEEPTAMQLAMQRAQERRKLLMTPVSQRAQAQPEGVQSQEATTGVENGFEKTAESVAGVESQLRDGRTATANMGSARSDGGTAQSTAAITQANAQPNPATRSAVGAESAQTFAVQGIAGRQDSNIQSTGPIRATGGARLDQRASGNPPAGSQRALDGGISKAEGRAGLAGVAEGGQRPAVAAPTQPITPQEIAQPAHATQAAEERRKLILTPVSKRQSISAPSVERRSDFARRTAVSEMSPEEMRQSLLTSDLASIPNKRAFDEHIQTNPQDHVLYGDLDNFKALNTKYGHEGADQILRGVGAVKAQVAKSMGVAAYHRSGDEFLATHADDAKLNAYGDAVQKKLSAAKFEITMPDGKVVEHKGVGFSYGTGQDVKLAESKSDEQKAERKRLGLSAGQREAVPDSEPRRADNQDNAGRRNSDTTPSEKVAPAEKRGLTLEAANRLAKQFNQQGSEAKVVPHPTQKDKYVLESRNQNKPKSSGLAASEVSKSITRLRAKWIGFTRINAVQSIDDIPSHIAERLNPDKQTEGFYDPETKSAYLIADNIASPERAAWVAAHEVVGHGGLRMLRDKSVNEALNLAGQNRYIRDLAAAIAKDRGNVPQQVAIEEAIAETAAAVETGDFQGIKNRYGVDVPTNIKAQESLISRIIQAVKRFLSVMTGKAIDGVSDADVRALIDAQREAVSSNATDRQSVDQGTEILASTERNILNELRQHDEIFRVKRSDGDTVEGITADVDPEISVKKLANIPGETRYNFTLPDGRTARMMVRPWNKYGNSIYGFDFNDGERSNEEDGRPGRNAEEADGKDDVWIDVSLLDEGGGYGAKIYAIAANYAYNTGKIFIGDPAGLSDEALIRRPEQMLSSALKFGTTEHLAPHPRQIKGDKSLGIGPLDWVYGDDEGNIKKLIDLNLSNIENAGGNGDIQYDQSTGQFTDGSGNTLTREDINGLAGAGLGRKAKAGGATLARAALLRSLASEIGEATGGGNGKSNGTLESLVQQLRQYGASNGAPLEKIFYSKAKGIAPAKEHVPQWAKDLSPEVQSALRKSGAIYEEKTLKQKITELKSDALKKLQYGVLDQFAPIKDKVGKTEYMLARMAKAADGTLEAVMLYGRPHLDKDGAALVDTTKKGFVETMQSLNGEHDRFFSWLAGRRASELKRQGRENLFTDEDISALSELNQGKMKDGSSREAAYLRTQKDVAELNKSVLDIAEQSGIIDPESRKVWASDFYVPFYRVMEEGISGPSIKSGLTNQKTIKKLKGGTNNLGDLTQNMLMNWSTLLTASAKNRAARATLEKSTSTGAALEADESTVRQMGKSLNSKAVSFLDNGKARWFLVEDQHLLAAISALEFNGYNNDAMKVMSKFKNYLTLAVTASPMFKARNLIRDSISTIAVSDTGFNPAENVKKGFSLLGDKQFKADMVAGGGVFRFGTLMEGQRGEHVKNLIDAGVKDETILDTKEKMQAFMQKLWSKYQEFGDLSENVNRAALYSKLRSEGKSHLEASFEARDLMDFGLSGAWAGVRALNQILPFFNARLQGIYKLGRAYNDDPKRLGYVVGAVSLASVALMLAFKDDDDWKKRSDSDRNSYWWFKVGGIAYRIPKPFEIGAMGSAVEHFTALFLDSENTDAKRFASQLGDLVNGQLAMNPIPQLFRPVVDIYANKDSFTGKPIETMGMQNLKPDDRYTYNTSELARMLGKSGVMIDPLSLVAGTGVKHLSPVQIDAMIKGYFSGLGVFATSAVDGLLHHTVIDRGQTLPLTLKDFAGSFAEELPSNSSRYVDAMYQAAQEIEQSYNSYRNAVKSGDIDKAKGILSNEGDKIAKYHLVEALKRNESRISQQIQQIQNSKEIQGEAKLKMIRGLRQEQDRIARAYR